MTEVPSGNLALSTVPPAVNTLLILADARNLTLSTFAPTVALTSSAALEVPSADLTFARSAPSVRYLITWIAPASNPNLLCPGEFEMTLVTHSGTGGRSLRGKKQYLQSDAGYWRIKYGRIRINSNADILKWREIEAQAEGRANPILVEAFDRKRAPIPIGGGPIIASANATAPVGTATVQILMTAGSTLIAGMHFSTTGYRVCRIRKIVSQVGSVYTVKVRPPLREAINSGEALEFDYPLLLVRLETDDAMNIVLDLMKHARPTVAFVEDPV